jgi:RHS repeat-associated protein
VHNYFGYDADSKRVTKQDSEGFTRFIYQGPDMLKLLQEQDENDDLIAHYTMGQGLEAMRRDGTSSFYHFDWLGSTFELTDADEDVTDEYLHNAWGEVLARTGTTVNPHGYVGRERYYSAGIEALYLLGFRFYNADLGRFVSMDPQYLLVQLEGSSRFSYADNDPLDGVDPDGLRPCKIHFWIGWADEARAALQWAANESMLKLERLGWKTQMHLFGTVQALDKLVAAPDTVGFAVGAHGGCGVNFRTKPWTHYVGFGDATKGTRKWRYAFDDPGHGYPASIRQVHDAGTFGAAYFGHCYDIPLPCPSMDAARRWYANALGVPADRVFVPNVDSNGKPVEGWGTVVKDFREFYRHFAP